jgi:hypothetical protein
LPPSFVVLLWQPCYSYLFVFCLPDGKQWLHNPESLTQAAVVYLVKVSNSLWGILRRFLLCSFLLCTKLTTAFWATNLRSFQVSTWENVKYCENIKLSWIKIAFLLQMLPIEVPWKYLCCLARFCRSFTNSSSLLKI